MVTEVRKVGRVDGSGKSCEVTCSRDPMPFWTKRMMVFEVSLSTRGSRAATVC